MKQINVDRDNGNNGKHPFWMPWGIGGVIWRYLLFLLSLILFALLLYWLTTLGHNGSEDYGDYLDRYEDAVVYEVPDDDPYVREYTDPDVTPMPHRDIDNPVPELPAPENNRIHDVPDDQVITDPDDRYKQIVATRLNVILNSDATDETYNRFARRFKELYPSDDYYINYYNALTKMMQITVPARDRARVKESLPSQIPDIDFKIFYEEIFDGVKTPDDPAMGNREQSWQFAPIQAPEAWDITQGSPEVVVAIIDSYIDVTHPELSGRIVKPYSVPRQDSNVLPPAGPFSMSDPQAGPIYHGTHVAAIAVGAMDNGQGSTGIAPGCTLMPISVGSQITSMKLIDATLYAIYQGADVINLSVGTVFPEGTDRASIEEQLEYIRNEAREQQDVWDYIFDLADERNCMIVWAAGNCNVLSGLDETKRNGTTLRVSSVDQHLDKSDFSNYGNYRSQGINYSDISAPGNDIYSAIPGNSYGPCGGTSMAAPIVTGGVALLKSINPKLTNAQIIDILQRTGKPLASDQHIGNLIQLRDALEAVGGEMANFDEIQQNHNNILGLWETTEERTVTNAETGSPTGEMCHVFLRFDTPESGTITYKETDGDVYTAPFTARYTDNKIYIDQTRAATSPTADTQFVPTHLVCDRGPDGTLRARRTDDDSYFYFIRRNNNG